jgi:hypothetical protein
VQGNVWVVVTCFSFLKKQFMSFVDHPPFLSGHISITDAWIAFLSTAWVGLFVVWRGYGLKGWVSAEALVVLDSEVNCHLLTIIDSMFVLDPYRDKGDVQFCHVVWILLLSFWFMLGSF